MCAHDESLQGKGVGKDLVEAGVKFAEALQLAIKTGRKSDRNTLYHLIYLAEACVLLNWLAETKPDHLHGPTPLSAPTLRQLAKAQKMFCSNSCR